MTRIVDGYAFNRTYRRVRHGQAYRVVPIDLRGWGEPQYIGPTATSGEIYRHAAMFLAFVCVLVLAILCAGGSLVLGLP